MQDERKIAALRRLLRRVREPVIVFTEYRDTLMRLEAATAGLRRAALLHGGLNQRERRTAFEAFTIGSADLLLATDAGSEGLNLQNNCRAGHQSRAAVESGAPRTANRARRPPRPDTDRSRHPSICRGNAGKQGSCQARAACRADSHRSGHRFGDLPMTKIDLRAEANREAARIQLIKTRPPHAAPARSWGDIPTTALRGPTAAGLRRSVAIFFTRTSIADGSGRLVEELLIPVEVDREAGDEARQVFERWQSLVRSVCLAEVAKRITGLAWEYRHGLARASARESHLVEMATAERAGLVQPGLFDRRAMNDRTSLPDRQREESLKPRPRFWWRINRNSSSCSPSTRRTAHASRT